MKQNLFPVQISDCRFSQDPENSYPPVFQVCSMSPHSDHLGMVQSGHFAVSFPGNWHCLHPKDLSDFRLEVVMKENLAGTPSFLIYFHARTEGTVGLYLELNRGILDFGLLEGTHYQVLEQKSLKHPAFGLWAVTVRNRSVRVECCGKKICSFTIPSSLPGKGIIAFDGSRNGFGAWECRIESLKLRVPECRIRKLPALEIPMIYGPHGIVTPYRFTLKRTALCGCENWELTLQGGPGDAKDHPEPRSMNAEIMENPYCRALDENGNELFKVVIARGRAGSFSVLRATYGIPDFVFPVSRTETVNAEKVRFLAFGYDYYESEAANSLAGGPGEILCDTRGKVLSFRKVYKDGACEVKLESPADKEIVKKIPKDIPDYENAIAYARVNHYFLEGETVRFRAFCVPDTAIDGDFVLSDGFKKPLRSFRKKAGSFFSLGKLAPGVYHLHARLQRHGLVLGEVCNAFEVIPSDPALTAQQLSGYPDIYPDTFLADYSHHFHPWGTAVVNVSHYTGTGGQYMYNTDHRHMKLLKLYHRAWVSRCQPVYGTRESVDYQRKHAAILIASDLHGKFYLHMPETYENPWMKEQTKAFAGKELSFDEIYPSRWSEWLDFIAPRCRELFKKHNTLRKGIKVAEETVAATYGCIYKGANYTRLSGFDLRNGKFGEIVNGFSVMEDYPYSSRYPLSRSTWQFTALTMEGPDVRHLPQVWGLNAETLDGHVVYGHPPYGISVTPRKFFYSRIMELLYGTAYFDGEKFCYWQGNGLLQSSSWTKEMFDEMISLFGTYREVKAVSPLRTPAYVYSRAACDAHEYFYEKNERFIRGGSMINTAEEFGAYLYEMARKDGQSHGFQVRMESLKGLKPSQVSLLVLPPLKGVPEAELKEVRRLHRAGVNLLCSEDAASLNDLFDAEHAECLLERKGKRLLTLKRNGKALAAFFTIAPSMQQRGRDRTGGSGQKALDAEVNRAAMQIMRRLGDYPVTAVGGAAITSFRGSDGHTYAFVQENSWPDHGSRIRSDVLYHGKVICSVELEQHESKLIRLD